MTTLQEAARDALEALEHIQRCINFKTAPIRQGSATWCQSDDAIKSLNAALAQQELPQKERPDFMAGYDAGMTDAKRMAQKGEPVYQYQMADGSWIDQIKDSYDYNRKYAPNATVRVVYTAAPAPVPQAQPAQASGRTNPGDETGGAVERFGWQTFLGKSPEIVPATNGSFVWYSDYLKLWQSAQPEDGCAPNHMCNGHRVHIPTGECCNKCGATSW